jgi:hypothetical protein
MDHAPVRRMDHAPVRRMDHIRTPNSIIYPSQIVQQNHILIICIFFDTPQLVDFIEQSYL